jgi:hypothetical protein
MTSSYRAPKFTTHSASSNLHTSVSIAPDATLWQGSGQNRAFHSVTWRVEEPVSGEILPKAAPRLSSKGSPRMRELLGATPGRCCGERMSGA